MVRDKKEIIIKLLRRNPDGLTIQEIANITNMSRITATKYISELKGAEIIHQRKVGRAKLNYLKKRFLTKVTEAEIVELLKKRIK